MLLLDVTHNLSKMKECKITQDIIDKTKNCTSDFSCLETSNYKGPEGCEVDYLYGDNIIFLKNSEHAPQCSYRAHFNNRQLCLCPTKFVCYSQQKDEGVIFKECGKCGKVWRSYLEFLSDPQISLVSYQVNFDNLELGLFLFSHSCNSTLAITASVFTHLHYDPIFEERATGTNECPGFCLYKDELSPCPAKCECAYVRQVLQFVRRWPKRAG